MDELKKNKTVIGITAAAVVGVATLCYLYSQNKNDKKGGKERTFAFIKPDAFSNGDAIMQRILEHGFTIVQRRRITLTEEQAQLFYYEHRERPFFAELVNHMTSGAVWALMLERTNAVRYWRDCMGATDPEQAKKENPNCLRALYGTNITKNAVHGSDSQESASRELGFFFDE
mmetsp:Transcript_28379/g.46619  ORF Transcript_28379/g.46619 Transcript_28379/m.46619 type:complete len:173 (+) Transcript_28379:198-716(+)